MDEDWIRASPNLTSKLADMPAEWNAVTERIIGAAVEIHRVLGPGLPERHYEEAMAYELSLRGLGVVRQLSRRIRYKGLELSECRLDLLVEDLVVVEIKAIDRLPEIALAQLVGYMRVFEMPLGLLINFHTMRVTDGIFRRVHSPAIGLAKTRLSQRPIIPTSSSAISSPSAPPRSS